MSKSFIQRVRQGADLWARYVESGRPDFEAKTVDIIGRYLGLPGMRRCSASTMTAIQALDPRDRLLPLTHL